MRVWNDRWIGCEHTVHVGPNLDLFGARSGSDNRRREVRAPAAEGRCDAILGCTDKASHYDYMQLRKRWDGGGQPAIGLVKQRARLGMAAVRYNHLARIHVD